MALVDRLHVLYVIDSLVPGGAESSLAVLAGLYPERGIDLEVAYLHDRPGLQATLAAAGVRLTSAAGSGGRSGWIRRVRTLVRDRRPDLVHTTLFEADIAGRLAGAASRVPVVSSLVTIGYGKSERNEPGIRAARLFGAQLAITSDTRPRTSMFAYCLSMEVRPSMMRLRKATLASLAESKINEVF